MKQLTVSEARSHLYHLIDEVSLNHEPTFISGKRHNAVLISEGDWSSIQETLHLLSVPKMRESIIKGLNTPTSECEEDLDW